MFDEKALSLISKEENTEREERRRIIKKWATGIKNETIETTRSSR